MHDLGLRGGQTGVKRGVVRVYGMSYGCGMSRRLAKVRAEGDYHPVHAEDLDELTDPCASCASKTRPMCAEGRAGRTLIADGHAVDVVGDGREALEWAATYPYGLVILDLILPGLDGIEVCRRLRASGGGIPILMFTALDQVEDRVRGLDSGADDYLPKPFAMAELLARVRALLRRESPSREAVIHVGDLKLIRPVSRSDEAASRSSFTSKEFALLSLLARHPGQVFSRDRLIDAVWDADFDAESNVVEVYIRSLRRKVDEGRRDGIIETVRGAGYRLRTPGESV